MSEREALKTKRSVLRRNVTNYIKKRESFIAQDDVILIELEKNIELLKQKETELKNLDREIEV